MSDEMKIGMKRRLERFPRITDYKKFGDELDRIYKKGKYAPKPRSDAPAAGSAPRTPVDRA